MIHLLFIFAIPKHAKTRLFALGKYFQSFSDQSFFVLVIVGDGALGLVLGSVEIVIEIAVIGRIPRDVRPAHAGLEGLDLVNRGAGDESESGVTRVQVREGRGEIVGEKGAAAAASIPGWIEHEVIDDELLATLEEVM